MNIFRNFWITLRTYPTVAALNIIGLGVAIAIAYMLALQIQNELGYNSDIKDKDKIVVIHGKKDSQRYNWKGTWSCLFTKSSADKQKNNAAIECLGLIGTQTILNKYAQEYSDNYVTLNHCYYSKGIFDIFDFEFIEGDTTQLQQRDNVAISEKTAQRNNLRVGDRISSDYNNSTLSNPTFHPQEAKTIVAVFRDFPPNSILNNLDLIEDMGIGHIDWKEGNTYHSKAFHATLFAKLREGFTPATLDSIATSIENANADTTVTKHSFKSVTLDNIYFNGLISQKQEVGNYRQGSLMDVIMLITVAVVIVVIAFINFLNFFLSLIPRRIRSVNIQKIMGASAVTLRLTFVAESLLFVAAAVATAILIVELTSKSELANIFSVPIAIGDNPAMAAGAFVAAMLLALATAVYPAVYVTSFPPVFALKGTFGHSKAGNIFRRTLVGTQFAISFALILSATFIWEQNRFIQNYDCGFDKENILVTLLSNEMKISSLTAGEEFADLLRRHENIDDVAYSDYILGMIINMNVSAPIAGPRPDGAPENVNSIGISVSWNFMRMMGIEITEGRGFSIEDCRNPDRRLYPWRSESIGIIFNEYGKKQDFLTTDNSVMINSPNNPILGFCENIHLQPLFHGMHSYYFSLCQKFDNGPAVYIKTTPDADINAVSQYVKECITKFFDTTEDKLSGIYTFDEILYSKYSAEQKKAEQVALFALIAIIVSLMGLFATVLFEVKYMEREIALRRVHGATVGSVLRLINIKYMRIVVASFVLAVPVAVYAVQQWLQQFAYKTTLHWYVFALAFMVVAAIAAAVVSFTAWRTANRNPMEVIK